jgi:peptide/nickel transport system ATP-binding protein
LQQTSDTAIILITHDMGVVAENADRVVVMYAGRKVEEASVEELFARPTHPYTRGLMRAIPRLDLDTEEAGRRARLDEIPGIVPVLTRTIAGCAFATRCGFATERCRVEPPPLFEQGSGHVAACWHTDRVLEAAA